MQQPRRTAVHLRLKKGGRLPLSCCFAIDSVAAILCLQPLSLMHALLLTPPRSSPHLGAVRIVPCADRSSRDLIYAALLRSMSPEHKFNSAAKLSGEVLAGVADGLLPLSECEEVLRDALCLMASKEIKVRSPVIT